MSAHRLGLVSVGSALMGLIYLEVLAFAQAGVFEYPIDDVYIHLAMADSLWRGEYGVNVGELSSAASSPLYPVLLALFAPVSIIRYAPLLINALALVGATLCLGALLDRVKGADWLKVTLALLIPISLNFSGIAFLGMEHALHLAATLALLVCALRQIDAPDDRRNARFLLLLALAGPLVRLEGLAPALAVAGALALVGQRGLGLKVALLAILAVLGFVAVLTALGIGPLPYSIQAKLALTTNPDLSKLAATALNLWKALSVSVGWEMLLAGIALLVSFALGARLGLSKPASALALIGGLVALAHLLFGQFGWAFRYEIYALALVLVASVLVIADSAPDTPIRSAAILVLLAVPAMHYVSPVLREGPASARAIHLQQTQMARLSQGGAFKAVAVNDIGRVAWRSPAYTLDLIGLASREVLELRRQPNLPQGWAGPLVTRADVPLIMIYEAAFPRGKSADWTRIGQLVLTGDLGWTSAHEVAFFAATPEDIAPLTDAIIAWERDLPKGARFVWD